MPLRSPSPSVKQLLRNLLSPDRGEVEAARARLTILGGRAVEALLAALDGGNDPLKIQAMPILALIRDARAREPLIALLMDREAKIREVSARSLSRFPGRETTVSLEKVLRDEPRLEVRIAALQSLVTIFDEGHEEALHEILGILFDPKEPRRLRLAAFAVLPLLSTRERRAVQRRLRDDPDHEVASRAAATEGEAIRTASEPQSPETDAAHLAIDLASASYGRWNEAMHGLIGIGSRALSPLIAEMRARHRDPEYASRAAMVMKGLGPRRLRPVIEHLASVVEPLPLEVLVDIVASIDDRPLTYRLRDLIESLDARAVSANGFAGPDPYARVRAKAHLALARLGSRVAIADLKRTLRDPARRIDAELLAAVSKIGTREELPDLLHAYRREEPWMRCKIREVFWQIVRREKIRRGGTPFRGLAKIDRDALREILDQRTRSAGLPPTLPGLRPRPARARSPRT